ncbi:sensor histidine kinase [Rhizobium sp. 9140]|uniref:sensor histidine kinase n=1 Tax=Rhizobium sp. 9140 TaxID=1761900 RepID=UPI000797C6C6|nr:PAS domain-containing sensor histidine kinase [Rhizobium sp. 9140]CZT34249.1 PAS domain S-box-containing protein [Rhizobium sp. 9140]
MPVKSYPFIDIAVHERVRDHFARGDAAILFAPDLSRVLWSNGEGAALFGLGSIYDFLDGGPSAASVAFRQLQSTARQLREPGETRRFLMRMSAGFQSVTVNAELALIDVRAGERAILFTAPRLAPSRAGRPVPVADMAARMISGFDDPDTHMAVLDGAGAVLASSPQFQALGMTQQTLLSLVEAVGRDSDWLLKRPVLTGKGTLPAAIGKVSADPALHLLFAVETILGHMDATSDVSVPVEAAIVADPPASAEAANLDVPDAVVIADVEARDSHVEAKDVATDVLEPNDGVDAAADDSLSDIEHDDEEIVTAAADDEALDLVEDTPVAAEPVDGLPIADETADIDMTDVDANVPATDVHNGLTDVVEEAAPVGADVEETFSEFIDTAGDDVAVSDDLTATTYAEGDSSGGDDVAVAEPAAFAFDPAMRSIRFVWKIGADGRFSEISREFALAVGPQAADVLGQSFADLAARFALDPDGTIVELLNRRDTWSGKTVLWPVEGEALCVPVDLAALPTYSRNREFDGFRGFGIVRVSDAVADPSARGLHLAGLPTAADDVEPAQDAEVLGEPLDEAPALPDEDFASDAQRETLEDDGSFFVAADEDVSLSDEAGTTDTIQDDLTPLDDGLEDGLPRDPFMGERPALKLVETPSRRHSDKIVPIDGARPTSTETLTRSEQAAFREIARQLTTTFGKRTGPAGSPVEGEADAGEEAAADPATDVEVGQNDVQAEDAITEEAIASAIDEVKASQDSTGDGDEIVAANADAAATPEPGHADEDEPADIVAAEDVADADDHRPAADAEDDAALTVDDETPAAEATGIPAGEVLEPVAAGELGADEAGDKDVALSPAMIDRLESAVLIHSGDELYHANAAFLELTGYYTLQDLRVEGGIDALFVGEDEGILDVPPGAMMMIRNDGRLVPVTARLQAIPFDDKGVALMMSLVLVETPPADALPVEDEGLPEGERVADIAESHADALETVEAGSSSIADQAAIAEAEARVEALRIETEELRAILETATDGVVVMGADGDIRSLNRSANALFNYNDADVIGKPFATLFAHESQRAVMDYLAGLAGHGVASVLNDGREVIGREASGGFIPLFMTMGRLSSSSGYCAVIRDITQWKRTEEELRSAKRAAETANAHKTDFLARVSHEIRTPLNAIIGFSDMMASEHFGPIGSARYIEYASDIGRSGRHVLDIVNDLLDISKIEAGEMELDFAAVEINEAVSEAVSLVQPQANAQRVIIRTSLSTSVPSVVADNRSIKQIALNILANAIRFTPAGGQIVVSTAYEANGSVMLRIRDTGVGMTRTELEQAMKPFRQVTTGTRMRGEGTGLGLPLTKAMAEANRALFAINSAPNEGTLVEITFPSQRVLAN